MFSLLDKSLSKIWYQIFVYRYPLYQSSRYVSKEIYILSTTDDCPEYFYLKFIHRIFFKCIQKILLVDIMKLLFVAVFLAAVCSIYAMHMDDIEYEAKALTMDGYMDLVSVRKYF